VLHRVGNRFQRIGGLGFDRNVVAHGFSSSRI
jgi:hypothetical protein